MAEEVGQRTGAAGGGAALLYPSQYATPAPRLSPCEMAVGNMPSFAIVASAPHSRWNARLGRVFRLRWLGAWGRQQIGLYFRPATAGGWRR